jgi:putative membrane protein
LTGIGIIGTFFGLIKGIKDFHPELLANAKANPELMGELFRGMEGLFTEVQGAFIASFFAIGVAMLVTLLEKVLLNANYRKLEALCRLLDGLYEGGVGEEYLASLVKSSEESATQTKQLKQSLVTELSELLRELNAKQIEQTKTLGILLSEKIQEHINANQNHGEEFRRELKEGLADIGKTVTNVTGGQGDTMTGMLEQIVRTFTENIQATMGGQMTELANMMNSSVTAMTTMQGGFRELLQDLRQSGKTEREDLTAQIINLIGKMDAQQRQMESQMTAFIESIQTRVGESQQKTMDQVRTSLEEIQSSVGMLLANMEKEWADTALQERTQRQDFTDLSKRLVTDMGTQVAHLAEHNKNAVESMEQVISVQLNNSLNSVIAAIDKQLSTMDAHHKETADTQRVVQREFADSSSQLMQDIKIHVQTLLNEIGRTMIALKDNTTALDNTSLAAIKGMNEGAAKISEAAVGFAEVGRQAKNVSGQLVLSADKLAHASKSLENQIGEYARTRDTLTQMMTEINGILERAKQEAGVNQKIVEDMREMVSSFGVLKNNMDEFVNGVAKLLAETMARFRDDMATHNASFHQHHADTLTKVTAAYTPLAAAIAGLNDIIAKTGHK